MPGKLGVCPAPVELTDADCRLREVIVAAALDELQVWGIERFSIEAVAGRAQVKPGTVYQHWDSKDKLIVDALVDHCEDIVLIPDTGSLLGDLTGHLQSLARYFNTQIGRSLLRTSVIDAKNWAPIKVRNHFWKIRVNAVRVIFDRAAARNELRQPIDPNIALQLLTGPLFLRGLYSNDPIDTTQFCATIADLVWRAVATAADRCTS
jgi:AcrR family transcriptional regulator